MNIKALFSIPFMLLPLLAAAEQQPAEQSTFMTGSGVIYTLSLNQHGGVLSAENDKLYLERNCDAYSPEHGKGSWGWANGGFIITFEALSVGFPRQEIDIGHQYNCRL